jgi:hypothetical protein
MNPKQPTGPPMTLGNMRELAYKKKEAPSANSLERRLPIRRASGCLWVKAG